ncbi:UNVERIFIED_ORG: putative nucleic acid-binding protein [Rhizobium aethiopicum]
MYRTDDRAARAYHHDADILTCDADFKDFEHVYIDKKD